MDKLIYIIILAFHPIDNALIERERIYVAPPDCHLLVEVGQVRLSKGLK